MAQTQTRETKTNWAMEKLIPKELAKNNKQSTIQEGKTSLKTPQEQKYQESNNHSRLRKEF